MMPMWRWMPREQWLRWEPVWPVESWRQPVIVTLNIIVTVLILSLAEQHQNFSTNNSIAIIIAIIIIYTMLIYITSNSMMWKIIQVSPFSGQQGCYGRIVPRRGGPHYIFWTDHNYLCFTENPQVEDGQGGQDGGQEAGGGNYSHQVPLILL